MSHQQLHVTKSSWTSYPRRRKEATAAHPSLRQQQVGCACTQGALSGRLQVSASWPMELILADHDLIHGGLLGLLLMGISPGDISTHSCQAATAIVEQIAPRGIRSRLGCLDTVGNWNLPSLECQLWPFLKNFKCEISEVRYWWIWLQPPKSLGMDHFFFRLHNPQILGHFCYSIATHIEGMCQSLSYLPYWGG